MIKPVCLQLSRKRGAKLVSPNGLPIVICDRRSKWGNLFVIGERMIIANPQNKIQSLVIQPLIFRSITTKNCLKLFREYQAEPMRKQAQAELRGKNLACWCDFSKPCHADIWLEIANEN